MVYIKHKMGCNCNPNTLSLLKLLVTRSKVDYEFDPHFKWCSNNIYVIKY